MGYGKLTTSNTVVWPEIGQNRWQGERDDYLRGKRPFYVDLWTLMGSEFPGGHNWNAPRPNITRWTSVRLRAGWSPDVDIRRPDFRHAANANVKDGINEAMKGVTNRNVGKRSIGRGDLMRYLQVPPQRVSRPGRRHRSRRTWPLRGAGHQP